MTTARVLALIVILSACKTTSIYSRGPSRRVQIEKQASEPTILAEGVRDSDGGVVVRVLELREIRATRRVQHAALELRVEHTRAGWLWELVEFPMAGFLTVFMPVMLAWNPIAWAGEKPGVRREAFRPVAIMLNPFRSMIAGEGRIYIANHVTFDDKPQMRQFNVRLPVGEVALRYRVLDAGRDTLASGEIKTDQFGKLRIADVPLQAVGIELVGANVKLIAPIEGAPPGDAAPMTEPVP